MAAALATACPGDALAQDQAPDTFAIYAIDVTGVTKLQPAEIEKIVYAFTGEARNNADVEAARAAIQAAYAAKGYEAVVATLPPQDTELFNQGVITIAVSEGPVGAVRVADGKYHSGKTVLRQISALKTGEPLNLKTLQSELDVANRFPDRQVTPVFVPGTEPGAVDVELNVESKLPLHASFEVNNDNSPSTTRQRMNGTIRYTNLWGVGHSISGSFVISPENHRDSQVFSGSYTAPILGTPWTMLLYGYKSNSNIAATGGSNVLGDGYQVGLRAIYRLPSSKSTQTISFGPDFKHFNQDIVVAGQNVGSTPIRYIPLTAEYNFFARDDSSGFAKRMGVSDFGLTLGSTFGLRVIKRIVCAPELTTTCIPDDQFQNREVDSFENFVHFNGSLTYSLTTKSDVIISTALTGQFADTHLVTNEQFAAGGVTSVRGYYQSEAVGDDGIVTNFEVQAPSLGRYLGDWVNELRVFGFVDGAYVHIRRTLAGQDDHYNLLGVGGGVRLRLFDTLSGEFTLAYPLRDAPTTKKNDSRAVFIVRGEF